MYTNKVEICGINTSGLPVMKDVEMKDMIERIRSGDRALRERFITGNLRLVLSVIQKFQNRGESMDDLFQVGCIGLIKALDNFDPSHEVKFSTYAVPMNVGRRGKHVSKNSCFFFVFYIFFGRYHKNQKNTEREYMYAILLHRIH